MTVITTQDGKHVDVLAVTSLAQNPDESLDVWCGGQSTHIDAGEDAEAFHEATQRTAPPPFEEELPGPPLLEKLREANQL